LLHCDRTNKQLEGILPLPKNPTLQRQLSSTFAERGSVDVSVAFCSNREAGIIAIKEQEIQTIRRTMNSLLTFWHLVQWFPRFSIFVVGSFISSSSVQGELLDPERLRNLVLKVCKI